MEDKKTLGNEVSVQEEAVTEKLPLSKTSDISDATKIELAEDKKEDKKSEQLKLEELINIAGNFVRGKITMEELDAFGNKMTIRSYIPMIEKVRSLMTLIYKLDNDPLETHEVRIANIYKTLFFDVLLGLYATVDVSNEELKTYAAYDLLYPIFSPFLLQYCTYDYTEFKKMFEDSLNLSHLKELSELMSNIDYQKLAKNSKEIEILLEGLKKDKKTIQNLADIINTTNPEIKKTLDTVQKELADEIYSASKGKSELKVPKEKKKVKTNKK